MTEPVDKSRVESMLETIIDEQREQRELIRQIFRRLDQGANIYVNVSTPDVQTINLGGLVQVALVTPPPGPAVAARIIIKGDSNMAGINVDTTTGVASLEFEDDKGDTDAAQPEDSAVAWSSDNTSVLAVDPTSGALTPGVEGTANLTAVVNGADGSPLAGFTQPTAMAVTVDAGAAITAVEEVTS